MTELTNERVRESDLEIQFAKLQVDALKSLTLDASDPNRPDPKALFVAGQKLNEAADTAYFFTLASRLREFRIAYAQFVYEKNAIALKKMVKSALPDVAPLKLAAEIVKKALKDLVVPQLNEALSGLYKHFKTLSGVLDSAVELGIGDAKLEKAQADLAAALKKIEEALKKIEDDARKEKEEAEKKKKEGAAKPEKKDG